MPKKETNLEAETATLELVEELELFAITLSNPVAHHAQAMLDKALARLDNNKPYSRATASQYCKTIRAFSDFCQENDRNIANLPTSRSLIYQLTRHDSLGLEYLAKKIEHGDLKTASNEIVAIRHNGVWVDLHEASAKSIVKDLLGKIRLTAEQARENLDWHLLRDAVFDTTRKSLDFPEFPNRRLTEILNSISLTDLISGIKSHYLKKRNILRYIENKNGPLDPINPHHLEPKIITELEIIEASISRFLRDVPGGTNIELVDTVVKAKKQKGYYEAIHIL